MSFVTTIEDVLAEEIRETLMVFVREIRNEIEQQGHVLTGKLLKSVRFDLQPNEYGYRGKIYWESYGSKLETGLKPFQVPSVFTRSRSPSEYLLGLIEFWQKRGLSGRSATKAAIATQRKHKREGMPTRASYRYSKNGARTGMVKRTVKGVGLRIVLDFVRDTEQVSKVRLTQAAKGLYDDIAA